MIAGYARRWLPLRQAVTAAVNLGAGGRDGIDAI
jgi:hypothetical protein